MEAQHIEHTLEPVFDERSRVLVLGTMPSPKSREVGFYYGHPQNRFWRVMEALFELARPFSCRKRYAPRVSPRASYCPLGCARLMHHRRGCRRKYRRRDSQRSHAHLRCCPHHACLHNRRKGHAAVPAHEWRHAQCSKHCAYRPSIHKRCERSHALEPACRSVSTNCTCRHRRQLPC